MRYQLVAIGRLRRGFAAEGCRFYGERLSAYAKLETLELREGRGTPEEVKRSEGEALLRAASGYRVALDEGGEAFGSAALAGTITALELRGVSLLSLLVGGAAGHGAALKDGVERSWSLSPLTLPHDLARLVLLEALYRAETIRAGHPYHRA